MYLKTLLLCGLTLAATAVAAEDAAERAVPDTPASRILSKAKPLGWGTQRENTFCGALESALAATDHPADYATLMGDTGLAFRVRWYQGTKGQKWSGSSPIGEEPEEIAAVRKTTGWQLSHTEFSGRKPAPEAVRGPLVKRIVASLDKGYPVLAYGEEPDMALIFGYEDGGRKFLHYSYYRQGEQLPLPQEKLNSYAIFLNEHQAPLSRGEAFKEALTVTVRNWKRDYMEEPEGRKWYGDTAFGKWIEDVEKAGSLTDEKDRGVLFHASWWNMDSLEDARAAGIKYLRKHLDMLSGPAKEAVEKAISFYEEEHQVLAITFVDKNVFLGPWTGKKIEDWTPEVREREARILKKARRLEADAVAQLEKALKALNEPATKA